MARDSCRDGSARSLAVKVTTPNPRNAKNVRATLATMSLSGGYPENARRSRSRLAIVETAKSVRMPSTTYTITVWAFATACDPRMFTRVITTTIRTANTFAQSSPPSLTTELA